MRKVAALERAVEKDEDPREAILKYAKVLSCLLPGILSDTFCVHAGRWQRTILTG